MKKTRNREKGQGKILQIHAQMQAKSRTFNSPIVFICTAYFVTFIRTHTVRYPRCIFQRFTLTKLRCDKVGVSQIVIYMRE